ncbi:MAG: ATP-dependent Clp protease adaptor ClpS [Deltaproteobacteria bacterium]|nr:ATP-dependent Clp protease adaptor ClpS [Deltaproteobacteria bacterium]
MDAVLLALAAAASAGGLWWFQSRPVRHELPGSAFDEDAEIALHVAKHEAVSRGQALSSVHLLFGLIQDEAIVAVLRDAGVDVEAFESAVLDALGKPGPMSAGVTERVHYIYAYALHSASHAERKASRVDLWAYLSDSDAESVLEAAGVSHVEILFRLCHNMAPPSLDALDGASAPVHVVLRNDDYTTRDFVCGLLTGTFGYTENDAEIRMMQTHTEGRGVVGRFRADDAKAKILKVRELARVAGHPLWIGIEPV